MSAAGEGTAAGATRAAEPGRRSLPARIDAGLGRRFWTLFSASFVANLADGIFQIALPLLAASLTRDPALVAGVAFASRLPWLVFALIAGALADRFDRRRTMILVDAGRALVLVGLTVAVLAGGATIWLLYLVAFVLGCFETMFDTAASSMLPNVVGKDRVVAANSRLNAVELTMNQFVGPPVGGFLVAIGVAAAFGTAAAGYLGALLCLLTLTGSFRPVRTGPPSSIREDITVGLSYLRHHRLLRTMALVVGPMNLASTAVFAVLVLYVVAPGPLGLDGVGFGLLITSIAVGTVGGTLARRLVRAGPRPGEPVRRLHRLAARDRPRLDRRPAAGPDRPDPRGSDDGRRRVQRRLRLDPPADRPEPPARPGDGELPGDLVGLDPARGAARRDHRPGVRADRGLPLGRRDPRRCCSCRGRS